MIQKIEWCGDLESGAATVMAVISVVVSPRAVVVSEGVVAAAVGPATVIGAPVVSPPAVRNPPGFHNGRHAWLCIENFHIFFIFLSVSIFK